MALRANLKISIFDPPSVGGTYTLNNKVFRISYYKQKKPNLANPRQEKNGSRSAYDLGDMAWIRRIPANCHEAMIKLSQPELLPCGEASVYCNL